MPQGQPSTVPDDGLTTRQRRNRPLLVVHTGEGRASRPPPSGWRCGLEPGLADRGVPVRQDRRSGRSARRTRCARSALTRPARAAPSPGTRWARAGPGSSGRAPRPTTPPTAARGLGADQARPGRRDATGFYVLDEFTYPMNWGWVDVDEVVDVLRDRPGTQHVVITGRDAPAGADRRRRPGHRDDQGQAPDGRRAEGPAGHRVVTPSRALVIAAPASGSGKTTVATGLMAALRRARADRVARTRSAPTTSTPATTRSPPAGPGRNLDPYWSARTGSRRCSRTARAGARRRRRRGRDGPVRRRAPARASSARPRTSPGCCGRRWCWSSTPRRRPARSPRWCTASRRSTRGAARRRDPQPGRLRPARGRSCARRWTRSGCRCSGALRRAARAGDAVPAPRPGARRRAGAPRPSARCARWPSWSRRSVDLDAVRWPAARRRRCRRPSRRGRGRRPTARASIGRRARHAAPGRSPSRAGAAFTFGYAEHAELLAAAGAEVAVVDPLRDERLPDGHRRPGARRRLPRGVRRGAVGQRAAARRRSPPSPRAARRSPPSARGLLYLARELDGAPDVRRAGRDAAMTAPAHPRLPRGGRPHRLRAVAARAPGCAATSSTARGDPPGRGRAGLGVARAGARGFRGRRGARLLPAHPPGRCAGIVARLAPAPLAALPLIAGAA